MSHTRRLIAWPAVRLLIILGLVLLLSGGLPTWHAGATGGPPLTTTATTVVSLISRGNVAAAEGYFAPVLQAAAPAARLQQLWQQLTAQFGAFVRQTGAQEQTANGIQSVFVHCVFARDTADLVLSFASSGKVDGLHVVNIQPAGPQATSAPPGITPAAALIRVLTVRPIQASWFAPTFLIAVSIAQMDQAMAGLTTELGPCTSLRPLPDGGYQVQCRDGTVEGRIHLESQGRIDDLTLTTPQLTVRGLHAPGAVAGRAAAVDALLTKRLQNHQFG